LAAVQDANDFNAVRACNIKYDVVADREASQTASQFRALASGQRSMHKHFEHFSNTFDQPIGRSGIVGGDKAQMESRSRSACGS
jgi:hypothetical protein